VAHDRKRKRDPVEERLASLHELRADPTAPESLSLLRAALADTASLVVAAAAEAARDNEIASLAPALGSALNRLLDAPGDIDKGCRAKLALTEALVRCGHRDPDLFVRCVRLVQMDKVWGGEEDSAAPVRVAAAMGLAHLDHPDALNEVVQLLADPMNVARAGGAQAAAYLGDRAAVPLLRFKALTGDPDAEVMGEVCTALLRLDPNGSIDFVATILRDRHDAADAAALALGESRLDGAFEPLKQWSASPRNLHVGLLAIALLRSERAFEHLLNMVARAEPRIAVAAVEALGTYRHDDALRGRVAERVAARANTKLTEAFTRRFEARGGR
jgi:HEAT repeat protein